MKTQHPNDAPAFPLADSCCDYGGTNRSDANGMSLRDYFAAKAMQSFISGHITHYGHDNHWPYQALVSESYEMADEMLKAR